jgi:hypothetical protein
MKGRIFTLVTLALLVSTSTALAAGKGSSMLSVGLGQNEANIFGDSFDETDIGAQYWYMFADDYAFAVSAGFGFGSYKEEDSSVTPTDEFKATISSYRVRVGGDRVGQVGDRFTVYMGPGVEFASAKLKEEFTGFPDFESENATTFGVNGRIGGIMMLSEAVGLSGEVSHSFGFASHEEGTDKFTWMPNNFGAFWGLTFIFGGN